MSEDFARPQVAAIAVAACAVLAAALIPVYLAGVARREFADFGAALPAPTLFLVDEPLVPLGAAIPALLFTAACAVARRGGAAWTFTALAWLGAAASTAAAVAMFCVPVTSFNSDLRTGFSQCSEYWRRR